MAAIHKTRHVSGPGTDGQCSGGLRHFTNEMRAFQMGSIVAEHPELTITRWQQSWKLIIELHVMLPTNSAWNILQSLSIWSNLKSEKTFQKWVLHELYKRKRILFYIVILSWSMSNGTISWLDCDVWWKVDCVGQPSVTCLEVRQRINSKAFSKTKHAQNKQKTKQKKAMILLMVCC